jgi:hypothetical protein
VVSIAVLPRWLLGDNEYCSDTSEERSTSYDEENDFPVCPLGDDSTLHAQSAICTVIGNEEEKEETDQQIPHNLPNRRPTRVEGKTVVLHTSRRDRMSDNPNGSRDCDRSTLVKSVASLQTLRTEI